LGIRVRIRVGLRLRVCVLVDTLVGIPIRVIYDDGIGTNKIDA
jgi:hypothetical protein